MKQAMPDHAFITVHADRVEFRTSDGVSGSDPVLRGETPEEIRDRIIGRLRATRSIEVRDEREGAMPPRLWAVRLDMSYGGGMLVVAAGSKDEASRMALKEHPSYAFLQPEEIGVPSCPGVLFDEAYVE